MENRNSNETLTSSIDNTGSSSNDTGDPAPAFDDKSSFAAAYERRLAEIEGVKTDELVTLNFDVHSAITTVLGVLPEVLALRETMSTLEGLDQGRITGLEDYAEAAAEANSRYITSTQPEEDIVPLTDQAMTIRETFRSDATALANRGLIAPERIAVFKGLVGYKNVAFDLIDWANLMRDCWPRIQGKTALSPAEIQQAKDVGERLVRAAGLREQGPEVAADVALKRHQALTLMMKAYDETRRAVVFLRWQQGDADTIAPSLYAGKTRRSDNVDPTPAPAPEPTPTPAPEPTPPVVVTPPLPHSNGVSAGLPGAIPFAGA